MTPEETKKLLRQTQEQRYRKQTIAQLNEQIEAIRKLAIQKVDKALKSDGIPDRWLLEEDNRFLSDAIIDSICRDRPREPNNARTKEEFDNLHLFL